MESYNYDLLISKQLTDQLTPEEATALSVWLAGPAENAVYYQEFVRAWELSSELHASYIPDTEQSWQHFREQLEEEVATATQPHGALKRYSVYQWAAAAVLVVGLGYLIMVGALSSPVENIIQQTTENRDVFYLPDSSMVWLNKYSSLTYAPSFEGKERVVYLKGQAFFEVKKNPKQPFVIYAAGTQTKVLGTSFDLQAYEAQKDVQLTVVTGKVAFTAGKQTIVLHPKDKGVFHKKDKSLALQTKDSSFQPVETAWNNQEVSYQGNAIYKEEKAHPFLYTRHTYQWRSNFLHQTVIEGVLHSSAKLRSYNAIYMNVTYVSSKKKVVTYRFPIDQKLMPGGTISYKKRLPDWFQDTKKVKISIEEIDKVKN